MNPANTKKALFTLFLVVATELIGFGLIIPILPQLAFKMNVGSWGIGILMATYSLAQFFAAPILGSLSDQHGRKKLLIFSKLGSVLGYLLLAVSHNFILFFIARLIDGLSGGNISIARAYVSDVTTPENRAKGMAWIGIAFGTGFIFGPALGGLLYGFGNSQFIPALAAAFLSFIALILTIYILEEPQQRKPSQSALQSLKKGASVLKNPLILVIIGFHFVFMSLFSGFETSFSVFTHRLFGFTEKQNSLLFVFAGLMTLIIQGSITRRSFKNLRLVVWMGSVMAAFGFFGIGMAGTMTSLLISLFSLSCGVGLVGSYLPALLSIHAEKTKEGLTMGIYEGIGSLSRVVGPLIVFGLFIYPPSSAYLLFSGVLFIAGGIFVMRVKS